MGVGGELLAHDAVEGVEAHAAVGVAQGLVGGEAHKVGVGHVDRGLEILLATVTAGGFVPLREVDQSRPGQDGIDGKREERRIARAGQLAASSESSKAVSDAHEARWPSPAHGRGRACRGEQEEEGKGHRGAMPHTDATTAIASPCSQRHMLRNKDLERWHALGTKAHTFGAAASKLGLRHAS